MSASKISAVVESFGGAFAAPPMTLPATLPLELSGESVRPRLCIFPGPDGSEIALRPDLTLPLAVAEAELRSADPARGRTAHHYRGPAFRLPSLPDDAVEFEQIGLDVFADAATPAVEAAIFAVLADAVAASGSEVPAGDIGDLSILPAFIEALDLSPATTSALKRAFREAGGISARLDGPDRRKSAGFAARLSGLSRQDAEEIVRETLSISGISLIGNRGLDEIVARLIEQGGEALSADVSAGARSVLEEVSRLEARPEEAADALKTLATRHTLRGLDEVLDQLEKRHTALTDAAPGTMAKTRFSASFGRRFTYYDGFVFDLSLAGQAAAPVAGGGRYDTLIAHLSAGAATATAIGGAIRMDRLSAQMGAAA